MRREKLFWPIGLAFFPVLQVLATASIVFVSYAGGVMKFVWPDARGWVAFIVVVAGALFQVGKLIHESSDKKKQEQQALELKRSEDQFAIYHLEGVCHPKTRASVNARAHSMVRCTCSWRQEPRARNEEHRRGDLLHQGSEGSVPPLRGPALRAVAEAGVRGAEHVFEQVG